MLENIHGRIEFILNVLTIIFDFLALLISLIVLICIIHHQFSTRLKEQEKILLILSMDIYFYIIFSVIVQLILAIQSLLGDLYQQHFHSTWCIINGYFIVVSLAGLYYSFLLQVISRLISFQSLIIYS